MRSLIIEIGFPQLIHSSNMLANDGPKIYLLLQGRLPLVCQSVFLAVVVFLISSLWRTTITLLQLTINWCRLIFQKFLHCELFRALGLKGKSYGLVKSLEGIPYDWTSLHVLSLALRESLRPPILYYVVEFKINICLNFFGSHLDIERINNSDGQQREE